MTEPKTVSRRLTPVAPGVRRWHLADNRIRFDSAAYAVDDPGGTVLIDPLPLEATLLARLAPFAAIILTVSSHQRSAWRYRERFGVRLWAPRRALGLEGRPDRSYDDGDRLPGGLVAHHAPGPAEAHFVLFRPSRPALAFCGDLLLRRGRGAPEMLAARHQQAPAAAPGSVAKLRSLRPAILCFGHGAPLTSGVAAALGALAGRDPRRS